MEGIRRSPKSPGLGFLCRIAVLLVTFSVSGAFAQGDFLEVLSISTGGRDYHSDVWGYSAPDGTELAIVGNRGGTRFVDVTDPYDPADVAFIQGPGSRWRDIKTYGHHAFIVNESSGGLQIVDLSDPLNPVEAPGSPFLGGFATCHNIFIDEDTGHLYAVGTKDANRTNDATVILDISDPESPAFVAAMPGYGAQYIHDIYVRDGVAYAAQIYDGALATYDVSSLPFIQELDRIDTPSLACHNTWLTDDGLYCVTSDETQGGHLGVFDVSDPSDIRRVGEWSNPESPSSIIHNAFVRGDFVFASWYTQGLQVLDITNPAEPKRVAWFDSPAGGTGFSGAWGCYPFGPDGLVYVSDIETGLYVFRFQPSYATVSGTVTDALNGAVIPGARVEVLGTGIGAETGLEGSYELLLPLGEYEFSFTAFGYRPLVRQAVFTEPRDGVLDAELQPEPFGTVSGTVLTDKDLAPLSGVTISFEGYPLAAETDPDGAYSFERVPVGSYVVQAHRFGFAAVRETLVVNEGDELTVDFELSTACFADDMETERGWTVEGDATSGAWERVDPIGTGPPEFQFQPEDDHSRGGTLAWITGQGEPGGPYGAADVDSGGTTLISPVIDLSGVGEATLVYYLWYSNDGGAAPGTDIFVVEATADGREWINLETLGRSTEDEDFKSIWRRTEIRLHDHIELTDRVRLRFTASDEEPGSLVEAAVDDLEIYCTGTRPSDDPPDIVPRARLHHALPNPFPRGDAETTILGFDLTESARATLEIIDSRGRIVRRIVDEILPAGPHEFEWDGRNDEGHAVAGGMYFQHLSAPRKQTRKILLMR